jgi:mono/diheme cytochrome c family protein
MNTRALVRTLSWLVAAATTVGILTVAYFVATGVSARPRPGRFETFIARTVRNVAIRSHLEGTSNPAPLSDAVVGEGRAHFADHCAVCHGNDGSGDTEMGRALYPRAPDMRLPATQNLSDAELFYIIENGIRLTGMPGWSTGTTEGTASSWHLVHFIRHLPQLTPDEIEQMEALNPKSPEEIRQDIEEERFLQGGGDDTPPQSTTTHEHTGAHE